MLSDLRLARLARRGARGRTGSSQGGGRYGLLLLVLIGIYLFSAFGGKQVAAELQVLLFALVLLLALRRTDVRLRLRRDPASWRS